MPKSRFAIGWAYELHLPYGPRSKCQVYHRGSLLKEVNLGEKAQRQLLVIELIQLRVIRYLEKPFRAKSLIQAVGELLRPTEQGAE